MRISDWSSDVCSSDLVAECGRDRAGTAARIDGAELSTRKRAEGGKGKEGAPDHATRFTSRSGTTMTFFGDAPGSTDRKSTRLHSSHYSANRMQSYACKKKEHNHNNEKGDTTTATQH